MAFILLSKEEIEQRRKELVKIAKILDDIDWVYGPKSSVKRHVRSEWAQKIINEGRVVPAGGLGLPLWLDKRIKALPIDSDAALYCSFCRDSSGQIYTCLACLVSEHEECNENLDLSPEKRFSLICKEFGSREIGVGFSDLVRKYIKEKFNGTQSHAAQAAQLDPQLVNDIYNASQKARNKKGNRGVDRLTVIALGLAFNLTLEEAEDFLRSAGYAFSDSDEDRLFRLCFKRRFYAISKINDILRSLSLKELGSKNRRE